ncbi:hypothetical protein Tco_1354561 [Tanacetum coccineum]
MSMTIQSSVKDKILATPSETSKYEYETRYHPGKANVVINALRRKERVKPRRVRAMVMTIHYGVRGMILAAQSEAFKKENGMMRTVVMDEAHASRICLRVKAVYVEDLLALTADSLRYLRKNKSRNHLDFISKFPKQGRNHGDDQLRYRWDDLPRGFRQTLTERSLVLWAEIQESSLIGLELVQETTNKVILRVSPWKGVMRFGKKGKLAPRYVGPFEILERNWPCSLKVEVT